MKRPSATVFGAVLMCARTISGFTFILVALANQREFRESIVLDGLAGSVLDDASATVVLVVVLGAYGLALVLYLLLALFVFLGHNWARIVAMSFATVSITIAFVRYWNNGVEITLRTTLISLTLDIVILLALSSSPARLYARRPRTAGTAGDADPGRSETSAGAEAGAGMPSPAGQPHPTLMPPAGGPHMPGGSGQRIRGRPPAGGGRTGRGS